MRKSLYLGIDTSAYTTSLVVLDESKTICYAEKIILHVPEGKRGLRQQEALFQHIKNLPILMEKAESVLQSGRIAAIGVSTRPRDLEDSYMPVFESGLAFAKAVKSISGARIFPLSHQMNHLLAADYFDRIAPKPCLAFHLSGGTTEILKVSDWTPEGIQLIGGSKDISFGKLVDRIGVALGGTFPSGAWLDQLALEGEILCIKNRIHVSDSWWNLSGIETWFQKEMVGTHPSETVAATLFEQIAQSLAAMVLTQSSQSGLKTVILAGGVASSRTLEMALRNKLGDQDLDLHFVSGEFSADHALGGAWHAWRKTHESYKSQSN